MYFLCQNWQRFAASYFEDLETLCFFACVVYDWTVLQNHLPFSPEVQGLPFPQVSPEMKIEQETSLNNWQSIIYLGQFLIFKGARSRYFRQFCLILLIMSSKCQIGRPRVFHLQNHGHVTTENDFPAVL